MKVLSDKEFYIVAQDKRFLFKRLNKPDENKYTLQLGANHKIQRHVDMNIGDEELAEVLFSMILEHQDGEWFDEQGESI